MGESSSNLRNSPTWNSAVLVDKAKEGSQAAWKEIYSRYRKMLKAHVQAKLGPKHDSDMDDACQTAFMNAYQHIEAFEYRGEGSLRRWLSTLVVHAAVNEMKRRRPQTGVADSALESVEDKGPRSKLDPALLEALGRLDDDDRDILIQRKIDELSFDQIAANLGVSREAARKRYAQAQERLRRLME